MAWVSIVGIALQTVGSVLIASAVLVTAGQAGLLSPGLLQGETVIGTSLEPQVRDRLRQSRFAWIGIVLIIVGGLLQIYAAVPR
jgi:hypothetical protein